MTECPFCWTHGGKSTRPLCHDHCACTCHTQRVIPDVCNKRRGGRP
jgi:hypothetical protein